MNRLILAGFAAVLASGLMSTSLRAQEVTLRLHTFMPPVANPGTAMATAAILDLV
jgi:hypothetical protein